MSTIAGKEEIINAVTEDKFKKEFNANFEVILKKLQIKNRTSNLIISENGDLSNKGIFESGRLHGRLDMLKLIAKEFTK